MLAQSFQDLGDSDFLTKPIRNLRKGILVEKELLSNPRLSFPKKS